MSHITVVKPTALLIWVTPNPEALIEEAGRTCYKSQCTGNPGGFVRMLMMRGHYSVIEHAVASFRITCDRGISHEIVRHRLASYSQESTRYCAYRSGIKVIAPEGLGKNESVWREAVQQAGAAYTRLLDSGVKPQQARSVLPTCLATEIVMTCNFREWRHFLSMRMDSAAHPQIQLIARYIYETLIEYAPNVFNRIEK